MKLLYCISLLVAVCCAAKVAYRREFEEWKKKFGVSYSSQQLEAEALRNFMVNLKNVQAHNRNYKRGLVDFELGLWRESDEATEVTNFKFNRHLAVMKSRAMIEPSKVPVTKLNSLNFTYRGFVNVVPYQGKCGSCWAFAAIAALEGQIYKKTKKLPKLSEQQLIDCTATTPWNNKGCAGGVVGTSYNYIQQMGIANASAYPLRTTENNKCTFKPSMAAAKVTSYSVIQNISEQQLKNLLAYVGPLAIGFDASQASFINYKGGIYSEKNCSQKMTHAMLLVGYDTDPLKGDFWLIRNSYGTSWGEKGYVRVKRNAGSVCAMTSYITYPEC